MNEFDAAVVQAFPHEEPLCRPSVASNSIDGTLGGRDDDDPPRMWLGGTAGPRQTPDRAGPSVVLRAGGTASLIDCGSGTGGRLAALGIDLTELTSIFFTHHHIDHHSELGYLLLTRWIVARGECQPLSIVGPTGTMAFVTRLLAAHDYDIRSRVAHGFNVRGLAPRVIEARDGWSASTPHWSVRAIRVEHGPVLDALGYRFDFGDGSVVISGDTAFCENLTNHASGVDVLVHEAILPGHGFPAYHTTPAELGVLAARAGVRRLVLTHLIPPLGSPEEWIDPIRERFDGPATVGRDLEPIWGSMTGPNLSS